MNGDGVGEAVHLPLLLVAVHPWVVGVPAALVDWIESNATTETIETIESVELGPLLGSSGSSDVGRHVGCLIWLRESGKALIVDGSLDLSTIEGNDLLPIPPLIRRGALGKLFWAAADVGGRLVMVLDVEAATSPAQDGGDVVKHTN